MITQTACTVFKANMLKGLENFNTGSPYTYKIALYNALADLDDTTTVYTTSNEVTGTGYTAGGEILTPTTILSDTDNNRILTGLDSKFNIILLLIVFLFLQIKI
mgnify:CR=1 FL=1